MMQLLLISGADFTVLNVTPLRTLVTSLADKPQQTAMFYGPTIFVQTLSLFILCIYVHKHTCECVSVHGDTNKQTNKYQVYNLNKYGLHVP
jgi:hypothetical protein